MKDNNLRVLSFDVEDWFHILDHPDTRTEMQWGKFESRFERNLERILSVVTDAQVSATFFCLGWIAKQYPYLIRKLSDNGYEIACHSHMHQLAFHQTPKEFRDDLRLARDTIADVIGRPVDTYRIPGFSLTTESLWALDVLAEEGIEVDCSVFPAVRGHGGLPQFYSDQPCIVKTAQGNLLKELPLNTYTLFGKKIVFSGGGYFRLLPYWLLKRLFAHSGYVMTYFHPRDFDPEQPQIPNLSAMRRFRSYVGLRQAESKLAKTLRDFDFVDVRTAKSRIDWDNAPQIKL